jgi:poly(3-hydroxyalkanoate) synthetase
MKAALDSGGATSSAAWATSPATFVVDLAPERSLVEYLVGAGQQVFTISWRNPDERHAD